MGLTSGFLGVAAGACAGAPKVIEVSAKTLDYLNKATNCCVKSCYVTTGVTAGYAGKTLFYDNRNAKREIKEIKAKEMPLRTEPKEQNVDIENPA